VNNALDEYFPEECGVRVIAEPGRFYVASAYTLATLIHSKRQVKNVDGTYSYMYYINDGVYGSFNCLLYDHAVVTPIPLKVSYFWNLETFKSS
jgi:ornithine decarboxylase